MSDSVIARMIRAGGQLEAAQRELSGSPAEVADAVLRGALDRVNEAKDECGRVFEAFVAALEQEERGGIV